MDPIDMESPTLYSLLPLWAGDAKEEQHIMNLTFLDKY